MSTAVAAPIHTTREEIEALRKVLYAQRTQAQSEWKWIGRGDDWISSLVSCGLMVDNLLRNRNPFFTGLGLIAGIYNVYTIFNNSNLASPKPETIESLVIRCDQENLDIEKKEIIKKIFDEHFSLERKTFIFVRIALQYAVNNSFCAYFPNLRVDYLRDTLLPSIVSINSLVVGFFGVTSVYRIMEMASELCAAKSNIVEELQKEAESQSSRTNIHTDKH